MTELNDYYTEGRIWVKSEKLEATHTRAGEIAGMLSLGETASLPDDVLALLNDHFEAINARNVGEARLQLAEAITPPYNADKARQIGEMLTGLTELSNAKAVELFAVDEMLAASFKIQFGTPEA